MGGNFKREWPSKSCRKPGSPGKVTALVLQLGLAEPPYSFDLSLAFKIIANAMNLRRAGTNVLRSAKVLLGIVIRGWFQVVEQKLLSGSDLSGSSSPSNLIVFNFQQLFLRFSTALSLS